MTEGGCPKQDDQKGDALDKMTEGGCPKQDDKRTETNTSVGAVSVSSNTMELAFMKLFESSYATTRMLVIGAGKMEKLVIKRLIAKGCTKMVIVNQSEGKSCRYHRGVQFRPCVPFL